MRDPSQIPFENSWAPPQAPMSSMDRARQMLSQRQNAHQPQQPQMSSMDRARQLLAARQSQAPEQGRPGQIPMQPQQKDPLSQNLDNPAVSPEQGRSFWDNFARHRLANVGGAAQNLAETFIPSLPGGNLLPANLKKAYGDKLKSVDIYKGLGVNKGLPDDIVQGLIEYGPYGGGASALVRGAPKLFSKIPNLAANMIGGAAYNTAQGAPEDVVSNAAKGAAWGVAGTAAGKVTDAVGKSIARGYANSSLQGLVDRATKYVKDYGLPSKGAEKLQGNFNKAYDQNKSYWKQTDEMASQIDKSLLKGKAFQKESSILDESGNPIIKESVKNVVDFNNSPIRKGIRDYLSSHRKLDPAERSQRENAVKFARYLTKKDKNTGQSRLPESFSGAVAFRKNLNQELKSYLEKNNIKSSDHYTKNLIRDIKKYSDIAAKENIKKVDKNVGNDFMKNWRSANKSTQSLQEYFKTPNTDGILKPRAPRREALTNAAQNGGIIDPGALKLYTRPSLRGNSGIEHLNKLTGNDQAAKSTFFRTLNEGGSDLDALHLYQKMSTEQRNRLLGNSSEGKLLEAANKTALKFGRDTPKLNVGAVGHHLMGYGLPGLMGTLGASAAGMPWDESIATGLATAGAIKGGQHVLGKYATPKSIERALNYYNRTNKNQGRYLTPAMIAAKNEKDKKQQEKK